VVKEIKTVLPLNHTKLMDASLFGSGSVGSEEEIDRMNRIARILRIKQKGIAALILDPGNPENPVYFFAYPLN